MERFKDHWDPTNPNRGSAYRCIRINGCRLDPVVKEAAKVTGLTNISEYLPSELTLWIDPSDVSYRFGEDGSICSCVMEGVSRSNTYDSASPTSTWSSNYMATNAQKQQKQQRSPVASRTASPSPAKRSFSTPVKYRAITPPSVLRSTSPNGATYFTNQVYDTFSRLDFAIPVKV